MEYARKYHLAFTNQWAFISSHEFASMLLNEQLPCGANVPKWKLNLCTNVPFAYVWVGHLTTDASFLVLPTISVGEFLYSYKYPRVKHFVLIMMEIWMVHSTCALCSYSRYLIGRKKKTLRIRSRNGNVFIFVFLTCKKGKFHLLKMLFTIARKTENSFISISKNFNSSWLWSIFFSWFVTFLQFVDWFFKI